MAQTARPFELNPNLLSQYIDSLSAPTTFKAKNLADLYEQRHLNAKSLLNKARMPGSDEKDPALAERLKTLDPEKVKAIEQILQAELTLKASAPAIEAYRERFTGLKNGISTINKRELSQLVKTMHADLRQAIEDQQKAEIEGLKNKKTELAQQISDPSLAADEATANAIVEQCIHTLKEAHKQELEVFDKAAAETHNNELGQSLQTDFNRIRVLNELYLHNKDLKDEIDRFQAKLAAGPLTSGGQDNLEKTSGLFKDISIDKLSNLATVTGTAITKDGKQLSLAFSPFSGLKGLWYSLKKGEDKQDLDLLSLAAIIRANGGDKITMTVSGCSTPEASMALARKAYKACILAGYKPEDITIKGMDSEGKQMDKVLVDAKHPASDELFSGMPQALKLIHDKGEAVRKSEALNMQSSLTQTEARSRLDDLRKTRLRTVETPAASSAPQQSTP